MESLAARISQPDLANLPEWQVAEILNQPDQALPERVEVVRRIVGQAEILEALGPDTGAAFLGSLSAAAAQRPAFGLVFGILERSQLNAGSPVVRQEVQDMRQAGQITVEQEEALLRLGEVRRPQSWAELHGIQVNAQAVSLARGSIT